MRTQVTARTARHLPRSSAEGTPFGGAHAEVVSKVLNTLCIMTYVLRRDLLIVIIPVARRNVARDALLRHREAPVPAGEPTGVAVLRC